ncbi:MAG: DNA translocase FtsK 4TM domain-containing protein, partial [Sterolibacterium sp.]|nr:DNA translocase FtsK 4TM domain-containing protein [Sterolibacterium sp.]
MAESSLRQPLPERIAALLQEARWLVLGALALYLILILSGFTPADPGWSHAATTDHIANPGGRLGAWLADLLFYLFGLSAWWLVLFLMFSVVWGYRRLDTLMPDLPQRDRRPFVVALIGFFLLLVASCGIEAMRFYSLKNPLPLAPGGMLGHEIGRLMSTQLGFSGGTLILMALFAAGITLFSGLSWLRIVEGIGLLLELSAQRLLRFWQSWQDKRVGRGIAQQREAELEVERKKIEE